MENKLTRVLCLGNQTIDTHRRSCEWAKKLCMADCKLLSNLDDLENPGVYHPDLSMLTIDDIWDACNNIDLLILLDQPLSSYDNIETYQQFHTLCTFKKQYMKVLDETCCDLTVWVNNLGNNAKILPKLQELDVNNANIVVELYPAADLEEFKSYVDNVAAELRSRNCSWIFFRASAHEKIHYEVTDYLLKTHPEFVLLKPSVFHGDAKSNIIQKIYQHWIHLKC